jgi:hypothetical protein
VLHDHSDAVDNQASEALKPPLESFAEGMARIHREIAAREKEAKETKETTENKETNENQETEETGPVSQTTVDDAAADLP